ncbi:MAG: hypothetical protein HGB10_03885 [Coriobacteriia bacterium]|nr:hypothetical protein [Coriobacteriia bacterium]
MPGEETEIPIRGGTGDSGSSARPWAIVAESVFLLAVGLAGAAVAVVILRLWETDLRVPFNYQAGGDLFFFSALVKGLVSNGWYMDNPFMGAPGGMHFQDFPQLEFVMFAIMRAISVFVHDPARVHNLYYLLGYPLAAMTSAFTMRRLGVSRSSAAVAGLLFTFLPFHYMRANAHLALGAYWPIPLTLLSAFWIYAEQIPFFSAGDDGSPGRFTLRSARTWGAIAIGLLVGMYGVYYAYFACALLVIAALGAVTKSGQWKRALAAAAMIAVIVSGAVIVAIPTLQYRSQNGANASAVPRQPIESEIYGLRVVQMVLPVDGHRIPALANLRYRYLEQTKINQSLNESNTATLGAVATLGLLALLLTAVFGVRLVPRDDERSAALLGQAGQLATAGILLATVGGLGSLVAILALPEIRGYNRFSVYIAFLSLAAMAVLADSMRERFARGAAARIGVLALLCLVVVIGVLDQVPAHIAPDYAADRAQWVTDKAFVKEIERALPTNAMVMQLPFVSFPEYAVDPGMVGFNHLRGYLHSKDLRWSYGTVIGRPGDAAYRAIAESADPVAAARQAGYAGLWIDRQGLVTEGSALTEAKLVERLGMPIMSGDERFAFFKL